MTLLQALLLGIVQGLCEFLPISSSGHLLLTEKLFGLGEDAGGPFFAIMLHVATLIAVCIVYRKTIWALIKQPFQKTVLHLIVATLPTVAAALLFKKVEPFASFYVMANEGAFLGLCFLLTAALLLIADYAGKGTDKRSMKQMSLGNALIIGCSQAVGVLPGVSRSGATITGALLGGLDKKAAADFSFLLSIPAILGGLVLEVKDVLEAGSLQIELLPLLVGMLSAGLTGFVAVKWMLKLIKQRKLWPFALYTALLGMFVIIMEFLGRL